AKAYSDGRPRAKLQLEALDYGPVLRHRDGAEDCDKLGARDPWIWEYEGTYYLHYDGAGPSGWQGCLATSRDLIHWTKQGVVLELGKKGTPDSHYAGYGPTVLYEGKWHLFYVAGTTTTPPPDRVPTTPYLTLKAEANSPSGPWAKRYDVTPFRP